MQTDFQAILTAAYTAATQAADTTVRQNPTQWYPCGFAWVRIKPARGKFVSFLKAKGIGRTDEYMGGYVIYNPSGHATQWMDAKYDGAKAFAKVLTDNGIPCRVESRID